MLPINSQLYIYTHTKLTGPEIRPPCYNELDTLVHDIHNNYNKNVYITLHFSLTVDINTYTHVMYMYVHYMYNDILYNFLYILHHWCVVYYTNTS